VDDLLEVSRLDRGSVGLKRRRIDVNAVVRDVVEDLRTRVGGRRIELAAGPPVSSLADLARVGQVVANLLENALKFSDADVTLSATRADGSILVDVVDQGGAAGTQGLGLGLSIARGFVTANGGELALEPRPQGGTRARLTLTT
jgi:signal transduction histidine kinase